MQRADITIKDKAFSFIGVYEPNATSEGPDFFRCIELLMTSSRRVVLVEDWNAVLDLNRDQKTYKQLRCKIFPKVCREIRSRWQIKRKASNQARMDPELWGRLWSTPTEC